MLSSSFNAVYISYCIGLIFLVVCNCQLGPCTDFGPTLSNVTRCVGNICNYTEILTDTIDLVQGSQRCFKFISPDPSVGSSYLRISVRSAFLSYSSDFSYVTGATSLIGKGYCGCPGGSAVSCSNCPVDVPNVDMSLCVAGNHQDSDCPLNHVPGVSGTYCFKLAAVSNRNIQVNHFESSPSLEIEVDVDFNGTLWYGEFDGVERTIFHLTNGLNITLSAASLTPVLIPEYAVWDYETLPDFYLLSNAFVNGLDECDPRKIGWIKPLSNSSTTACESLLIDGDISVQSCNDNQFKYRVTAVDAQSQLLNNLKQYKVSQIAPGALLSDQHFNLPFLPNNTVPTEGIVVEGFALVDADGFKILGFDYDGDPVPQAIFELTAHFRQHRDCEDDGGTIAGYSAKSACTWVNITAANGTFYILILCKCVECNTPMHTSILLEEAEWTELITANFNCTATSLQCQSTSPTINKFFIDKWLDYRSWPDYGIWRAHFSGCINIDENLNETFVSSRIFMPISTGSLAFKIAFSDLTVTYETSSTKPMIDSIDVNNDDGIITVYAHTLTTPGRCYIVAKPALNFPVPVDLTTNSLPTAFHVQINQLTGNFDLRINCANYVATKAYDIDFADPTLPINETDSSVYDTASEMFTFWDWKGWDVSSPIQRLWKILSTIGIVLGAVLATVVAVYLVVMGVRIVRFFRPSMAYSSINGNGAGFTPSSTILQQYA